MIYKRLAALTLALLCLTSCAAMLDREATYTSPHVEDPPASLLDAYRVNTYSGLCSALQSYVEEGMTEGSLRFPVTYPGNLTVDLEKAKRQLMEEDPLGCYALSDIAFHINRIIAYYEVTAAFDYRVPPVEYMNFETVRTDGELDAQMEKALEEFGGQITVILARREEERDAPEESLHRVYNTRPDLALGEPTLEVTYYPETGPRAVAEIKLTYPESATVLHLRQRNLLRAAQTVADAVEGDAPLALRSALLARCTYDRSGGGTATAALLDGTASDEGLARAFDLLCGLKEIKTLGVVEEAEGWHCLIDENGVETAIHFKPDAEPSTQAIATLDQGEEETT